MSELDKIIIDMYKKGYSLNCITDYCFSYNKRNVPKNNQFKNCFIFIGKKYTRLDCYLYISRVILNYNNSLRSSNV